MKSNKSKYKLVVDYVIDGINEGRLKKGAWSRVLYRKYACSVQTQYISAFQ